MWVNMLRTHAPVKNVGWCIGSRTRKNTCVFGRYRLGIFEQKGSDQVSVLDDVCLHRGASISDGEVTAEGCIKCPYHGWTYTPTGNLTEIPNCSTIPLYSKLHQHQHVELYDLVWVSLDKKKPPFPPVVGKFVVDGWKHTTGDVEVMGNWTRWIEELCTVTTMYDGTISDMHVENKQGYLQCDVFLDGQVNVIIMFHFPNTIVTHIQTLGIVLYTTVTPLGVNKTLINWVFGYTTDRVSYLIFDQMLEMIRTAEKNIQTIPPTFECGTMVEHEMFQNMVMTGLAQRIENDPMAVDLREHSLPSWPL